MIIQKNRKRRLVAEEEINVAPEATELLFEAEDVAELVSEVTGQDVEVTADENTVTFAVGEDEFVVEAEGDEGVVEESRRIPKSRRPVKASTRRPVKANKTAEKSASRRTFRTIKK